MNPIWYDSTETGAPTLNNVAASGISVLLACLRDGFNVKGVTQIVVTSGVAVATCPAHGYSSRYGKRLKISGASVPTLNGVKDQTIINANSFSYPAPGVADGTYTGTMDARRAPLGWDAPYASAGVDKVILRRLAPEANAQLLRVDDTAAGSIMRVRTVESATDVDTVTGLSPTDAQVSGGGRWQKGDNTATAKKWAIVGTDRAFYLMTQLGTADQFIVHFFGDGVPYAPGDAYFTLLSCLDGTAYTASPGFALGAPMPHTSGSVGTPNTFASRGQLPAVNTSERVAMAGPYTVGGPLGGSGMQVVGTYAHIGVVPAVQVLGADYVRGEWPGIAVPLANLSASASFDEVVAGAHRYLAVPYKLGVQPGCLLLRVSGEWH